jgi:hypothetical protein
MRKWWKRLRKRLETGDPNYKPPPRPVRLPPIR